MIRFVTKDSEDKEVNLYTTITKSGDFQVGIKKGHRGNDVPILTLTKAGVINMQSGYAGVMEKNGFQIL